MLFLSVSWDFIFSLKQSDLLVQSQQHNETMQCHSGVSHIVRGLQHGRKSRISPSGSSQIKK